MYRNTCLAFNLIPTSLVRMSMVSLANLNIRPEALARYYVTSHWQWWICHRQTHENNRDGLSLLTKSQTSKFRIYDDVDDLWHHWAKLYNEVLDKHAPIKKKRVRGDQLPWITPQIQREISRRNRLFKKHAKNPTKTSWEEFKKQRNKVTSLKRKGLKAFCMEASTNTRHHGEFWNKLRSLLPKCLYYWIWK